MAEIKWLGHACFRVRAREATVLLDPVPRSSGYKLEKQRANIVTISHRHPGHEALDILTGDYTLIDGPGEYEIGGVFITGIQTWHDEQDGKLHGKNTAYLVEVEGLVICHLGDLGHELTDEQAEAMSSVDVLIVPVGGGPVLDAEKAALVVGQVEPRIVVPMQYRTGQGDAGRADLDPFLSAMAVKDVRPLDKLTVKAGEIGETTQVVVLEP
jgi:L-ascorbate metabolism protein UlaG (beta-lactamase superfamily)